VSHHRSALLEQPEFSTTGNIPSLVQPPQSNSGYYLPHLSDLVTASIQINICEKHEAVIPPTKSDHPIPLIHSREK